MLAKIAAGLNVNRTILALSVARLGDAMGNSILYIVILLYVAALAAPMLPAPEPIRVAILISLYGLVNSVIQPLMGSSSDRLGRRKLLIQVGLLVMGICTLSFIFADQFSVLLALRSLQGVGVAMTVPASLALIAAATKTQTRGSSMGVYTTMRWIRAWPYPWRLPTRPVRIQHRFRGRGSVHFLRNGYRPGLGLGHPCHTFDDEFLEVL
jgi:MFS family permease